MYSMYKNHKNPSDKGAHSLRIKREKFKKLINMYPLNDSNKNRLEVVVFFHLTQDSKPRIEFSGKHLPNAIT